MAVRLSDIRSKTGKKCIFWIFLLEIGNFLILGHPISDQMTRNKTSEEKLTNTTTEYFYPLCVTSRQCPGEIRSMRFLPHPPGEMRG